MRIWAFILTVFLWDGVARSAPPPAADDQLWNDTRLVYKINQEFSVFSEGTFYLGNDFGDFNYTAGRLGFTWKPTATFALTPSYLYEVNNPGSDNSFVENRLCLMMTKTFTLKSTTLTLLNTTEYRMPEEGYTSWRLRPKIILEQQIGPEKIDLQAYVADELFYVPGQDTFTKDRAFAGLEKQFDEDVKVRLYYCREIAMVGGNRDLNILGIETQIFFGPKKLPDPEEEDSR